MSSNNHDSPDFGDVRMPPNGIDVNLTSDEETVTGGSSDPEQSFSESSSGAIQMAAAKVSRVKRFKLVFWGIGTGAVIGIVISITLVLWVLPGLFGGSFG